MDTLCEVSLIRFKIPKANYLLFLSLEVTTSLQVGSYGHFLVLHLPWFSWFLLSWMNSRWQYTGAPTISNVLSLRMLVKAVRYFAPGWILQVCLCHPESVLNNCFNFASSDADLCLFTLHLYCFQSVIFASVLVFNTSCFLPTTDHFIFLIWKLNCRWHHAEELLLLYSEVIMYIGRNFSRKVKRSNPVPRGITVVYFRTEVLSSLMSVVCTEFIVAVILLWLWQ